MSSLAVLVPVLGRPHRVAPLVASLEASHLPGTHDVGIHFVVSREDLEQQQAVEAAMRAYESRSNGIGIGMIRAPWHAGAGDYAKKINYAFRLLVAGERFGQYEWAFLGADDLEFKPGWFHVALRIHSERGACVIGTNDIGNSRVVHGNASTHSLVHRRYGECGTIDEPDSGKLLHEGYDHNFVDDEFVQTALCRETYWKAHDVVVEHLHPHWRKGEQDATYVKGQRAFAQDSALFTRRRPLWEPSLQAATGGTWG